MLSLNQDVYPAEILADVVYILDRLSSYIDPKDVRNITETSWTNYQRLFPDAPDPFAKSDKEPTE
jgi:hypothetical protein